MIEKFKRKVLNKFLQIIRQAYATVVSSDTSEYPQGQVTSNGKPTLVTRLSIYGIVANPPLDSHVLMLQSQGQESTKFGVYNDFLRRKKELTEGECALYNTLTGAIVYMKADGSIVIDSPDESVDISANTEITATAPVVNVIAATEVKIVTPKAIIESGNIELGDGGAPALEKLINETGMALINSHTHTYNAGPVPGATTTPPTQQMATDTDTTKDTKAS